MCWKSGHSFSTVPVRKGTLPCSTGVLLYENMVRTVRTVHPSISSIIFLLCVSFYGTVRYSKPYVIFPTTAIFLMVIIISIAALRMCDYTISHIQESELR